MDNAFDQRLLDSFVTQLLTPQCFDVDFPLALDADGAWDGLVLVSFRAFRAKSMHPSCHSVVWSSMSLGKAAVVMPDCVDRQGYMSWLETLPNSNPTTWLGLGPSVEAHILASTATRVLAKVRSADRLSRWPKPQSETLSHDVCRCR